MYSPAPAPCGSWSTAERSCRRTIPCSSPPTVRRSRPANSGTGSIVSWQLPTRIDRVVLSIALARLGAVQNPIIHLYREREVGFALRQTGAELFVIPATWRNTDFAAIAEAALAGVASPPTIFSTEAGLPEGDPAVLPAPPEGTAPEDAPIRWIYYTSGSTADPKGVQH